MELATRLYSFSGLLKEQIYASNIKSPSDARKLGPFVDTDKFPVTWVNWSKPRVGTFKKTPPYFRHYPQGRIKKERLKIILDEEIKERQTFRESKVHNQAKIALANYLTQELQCNSKIEWAYKDNRISEYSLTGDLLSEVVDIKTEYYYRTPFDTEYKFDIVLLGKKLNKGPIILGAIEIEKENKFGLLKCLLCKSLGFPLISINIENLQISDIDEKWCKEAIRETTESSEDSLRRNYIYIHNFLYPVFINLPQSIRNDTKHQYIVFVAEEKFDSLYKHLEGYKKLLGFVDNKSIHIHKVCINEKEPSSLTMFKNEGSIAGSDWKDYNPSKYIRITLDVPTIKKGNIYLYHLVISRLLNSHYQTLTGYKYAKGLINKSIEEPVWSKIELSKKSKRIIPKQMSEPIKPMLDLLQMHGMLDKIISIH